VHAIVCVVATIATVIHLTFGCCLHASHVGQPDACHECADHGPDTHVSRDGHDHDANPPSDDGMHSDRAATGHDCDGCTCAAVTEDDTAASRTSSPDDSVSPFTTVPSPSWQADTARPRDRGGSPPPRDTHPLHERLLV